MNHSSFYPKKELSLLRLLIRSIKYFRSSFIVIWPFIVPIVCCYLASLLLPEKLSLWLEYTIDLGIMIVGLIFLIVSMSCFHYVCMGEKKRVFPTKKQWKSVAILIFYLTCLIILAILIIKRIDATKITGLFLDLGISSALAFIFLSTVFAYPLIIIHNIKLAAAFSLSITLVSANFIKVILLYLLVLIMALLVLPSSEHMALLEKYFLNIPAAIFTITGFLPIIINYWLLLTNDCTIRHLPDFSL